jgi:ASC-1-like (ASCH) protein
MRTIEKKVWPEYFKKIKENKKQFEVRLADFEIEEGDILILKEWDPEKKEYTGEKIKVKAGFIIKIPENMEKFHTKDEIDKNGFYVISLQK